MFSRLYNDCYVLGTKLYLVTVTFSCRKVMLILAINPTHRNITIQVYLILTVGQDYKFR